MLRWHVETNRKDRTLQTNDIRYLQEIFFILICCSSMNLVENIKKNDIISFINSKIKKKYFFTD